jgi:hypothetical protein
MLLLHAVRPLAIGLCLLAVGGCSTVSSVAAAQPNIPQLAPGNARVWFIRQFEPDSLAQPMIYANRTPIAPSEPGGAFYRDFPPGTYTFTVDTYYDDLNQGTTLQLTAGTQSYLEIQSLRISDGETWGRDAFYVRVPSPYFLTKYYLPQMTYLGAR